MVEKTCPDGAAPGQTCTFCGAPGGVAPCYLRATTSQVRGTIRFTRWFQARGSCCPACLARGLLLNRLRRALGLLQVLLPVALALAWPVLAPRLSALAGTALPGGLLAGAVLGVALYFLWGFLFGPLLNSYHERVLGPEVNERLLGQLGARGWGLRDGVEFAAGPRWGGGYQPL
jgi:hypothetical protein